MTEEKKIEKVREIYQSFLAELTALKHQANERVQNKIKLIEEQKIEEILAKIHKDF